MRSEHKGITRSILEHDGFYVSDKTGADPQIAPKALPAYSSRTTHALEHAGHGALVQEAWRKMATRFWFGHSTPEEARATTGAKIHRVMAKHWLWATSHQLESACGCSWRHWQLPADEGERPPAAAWRTITVSIDQGSDGWAATHWLMAEERVVMLLVADTNHRCWNDIELSLRGAGLWQLTLMCTVLIDVDDGAWRDARWWEEARSAAVEFASVSGADCPLLGGFAPALLAERGEGPLLSEDGLHDKFHGFLRDSVEHKMPRISMCRWFAYMDSMKVLLGQWSARLVLYIYIALQLGKASELVSTNIAQMQLKKMRPGQDVEKSTAADDREEVRSSGRPVQIPCCMP